MGLGFWNKLKEFGKKVWGGVTSVFNNIVKPIAKGPIGGLIQSVTHVPVQQIVQGVDTGIHAINNLGHTFRGTNINNAAARINQTAQRGMSTYEKYKKGGIDAVLNRPDS
jgi:phage-related protein